MASMTAGAWATLAMTAVSTAGSIQSAHKQRQSSDKARRQQQSQIAQATAEAKAEKDRLENIENERLERLRKRGSGLPPSLLTGMSGAAGAPTTAPPVLGV